MKPMTPRGMPANFFLIFLLGAVYGASGATSSLFMKGEPGDFILGNRSVVFTPAQGSFTVGHFEKRSVTLSFGGEEWFSLSFVAPDPADLVPGEYLGAMRSPFRGTAPGLELSGNGRGCNTLSGEFVVKQIEWGPGGEVAAFWATFEQHCDQITPAVRGEFRWNADVPFFISAPTEITARVGQSMAFDVSGIDTNGLPVTLSATGFPAGVTFEHHASHSATVSRTPTAAQIGRYDFYFHATNSAGQTEILPTRVYVKAVVPTNDELTNATAITAFPFLDQANISEATTGSEPMCKSLLRTVWYSFIPSANTRLKATAYGSDFPANVAVYEGTTNGEPVACGEGTVRFDVLAGHTYLVQVGTIASYFPPNGSHMVFSIKRASDVSDFGFYKGNIFYQKSANHRGGFLEGIFTVGLDVDPPAAVSSVKFGGPIGEPFAETQSLPGTLDGFSETRHFESSRALDAAFPQGSYVFTVVATNDGASEIIAALPANHYPNIPHVTNWRAAQAVNAAYDFTLTWEPFMGTTSNDVITVVITDASGNIVFETPDVDETNALPASTTMLTIPGSSFIRDAHFIGIIVFARKEVVDRNKYPGAVLVTGFLSATGFDLRVAHPSSRGGKFEFAANGYAVSESNLELPITVWRRGGSTGAATVDFTTADNTATGGTDYTPVTGTLEFADGETSKTFVVPILADSVSEGTENFTLRLLNPTGSSRISRSKTKIIIKDE